MRVYKEIEKIEKQKIAEIKCDICGVKAFYSASGSLVVDWQVKKLLISNAIWIEDEEGNYYTTEFCPDCFREVLGKWLKKVES